MTILKIEGASRPWDAPPATPKGMSPSGYWLGSGNSALEVAVAQADKRPTEGDVRKLWSSRKGSTASPLLLVVTYTHAGAERCGVCGPSGSDPVVLLDLDTGQVGRIANAALAEPDRHAASRFLQSSLPEAPQELFGLRNAGMFASHDLRAGIPHRPDWKKACKAGLPLLDKRGRELVEALGFEIEQLATTTSVLTSGGRRRAIAVFLEESETPETSSPRFDGSTPISKGLADADAQNLPYVVLTRGPQIRIYSTDPSVGVGRKGRAETMIEANLALLADGAAGYLPLIFGAEALAEGGSFDEILESSRDFATALGERLRSRVYEEVIPALSRAVASHANKSDAEPDLQLLYEQALFILFRLLFIAYAEDKDLLPYRTSGAYNRHALKTIARELAHRANDEVVEFDEEATSLWNDFDVLCRAVDVGNQEIDVPAYNGGLFSSDTEINHVGSTLDEFSLTNAEFGPALMALLVDLDAGGTFGPVDFRSLSVREFGTIYEGLLESNLSIAPSDLALDDEKNYVPAEEVDDVVVPAGDIYLHNRSGARRSTGSYFTKAFAVEHLLDHALEPALQAHLGRLQGLVDDGSEAEAAAAFFDFRCADIAMGSGHFLVAAVDRIEARLSSFLARNPIPGVIEELERLRLTALEALGDLGAATEIEHASLLRRQVARRCVYGVDRNEIAVELARLGIWIHTFVPGLPLGFLDHSLRVGDSLTGIGSIKEAEGILNPDLGPGATISMFAVSIKSLLEKSSDALKRLARASDASAAEVKAARAAEREASEAVEPVAALFDLLVSIRLGRAAPIEEFDNETVAASPDLPAARQLCRELNALHFPVAFPEVFLRERPGFDCLLGNPPWEEVTVEELRFWSRHFPGVQALPQGRQRVALAEFRDQRPDLVDELEHEIAEAKALRDILIAGPYEGMGTGDPDLYKAFTWRLWHLVREDGSVGVVLPRSALSAAGSGAWRRSVFDSGEFTDVTTLKNRAGWVFDDVTPQYTIVLIAIRKGHASDGTVRLRGPYSDLARFRAGVGEAAAVFPAVVFRTWLSEAAFPMLPGPESGGVFIKLRSHPRLDDPDAHTWKARPVRELDATNDRKEMIVEPESEDGLWPVYTGASFDIWNSDTGHYFAWADPAHIVEFLSARRARAGVNKRSALSQMSPEWLSESESLPVLNRRLAFRDIARATDRRTLICALIPSYRPITNTAPYLVWPKGDARDEAFLLGALCSRPLDWYARRVVELHVNFHILNSFPIPALAREDELRLAIEAVSGRLAAQDERFEDWAEKVGVDCGPLDQDEKSNLIIRLDALVARAYGLSASELKHIFETFHEGWDYVPTLEATLAEFKTLS